MVVLICQIYLCYVKERFYRDAYNYYAADMHVGLMQLASPADVCVSHHAILPTKAVFSLNFSSAAKGPFIASKTMCTLLRPCQGKFRQVTWPKK